jgi:hypothetical protein
MVTIMAIHGNAVTNYAKSNMPEGRRRPPSRIGHQDRIAIGIGAKRTSAVRYAITKVIGISRGEAKHAARRHHAWVNSAM